jgi:small-conductance mechanosensitive channel
VTDLAIQVVRRLVRSPLRTLALLMVLAAAAHAAPSAAPPNARATSSAQPTPAAREAGPAPSPSARPPAPSAASASSSPSGASSASASAASDGNVRIHDRKVFVVKAPRGGLSAAQRAREATQALERAVDDSDEPVVRVVEEKDDAVVVFAGSSPVIQFGPADAEADGDASVKVHAEAAAAKITDALGAERKRSAIATTVFSISLLVLSGLLAFLVLRKLGELVDRARAWIVAHPDGLPQIRIANVELLQRASLRGVLLVAMDAAKWIVRIGVGYVWLLFALSSFSPTRAYGERLGGVVLAPISALMGRAVSAFPVLIVGAFATLTVVLLVRFVGLFFGSVARRETRVQWLPVDLAAPTSVLVRGGIILVALLIAAPLVTGTDDGALARAGMVALAAVGLASTPLLASATVGVFVVFGRRLRVGEFAEVGGRSGIVLSLSLLEVAVEDREGCEVRVPHLVCLFHPTRLLGPRPPVRINVSVAAAASQAQTLDVLTKAATLEGARVTVELVDLDADGARYSVTIYCTGAATATTVGCAIADALTKAGIALGHGSKVAGSP